MNWRNTVTDPEEVKIFLALAGPNSTWRTLGGIAREAGLTKDRVSQTLAKYDSTLVRVSETPSITGDVLVGLIEKVGPALEMSV